MYEGEPFLPIPRLPAVVAIIPEEPPKRVSGSSIAVPLGANGPSLTDGAGSCYVELQTASYQIAWTFLGTPVRESAMKALKTPHIPSGAAALISALTFVVGQLAAFVPTIAQDQQILISAGSAVISAVFLIANAIHALASAKTPVVKPLV